MKKDTRKPQSENGGGGRIPQGQTIAEYLVAEGYSRGVDINNRPPYDRPVILNVQGGKKYEIGPTIAQGGMGIIVEARDLNSRRVVALKVLPKNIPLPRHDLLRFIREGQLTSQLEHPNIVPVHEIGLDEDGNVFYTMKLVEGRTLTSILQGVRKGDAATIDEFPLARLLNIYQKVCDAVAFAHSKNVVHRDLKPDNIMVGRFGEVQVMDWGLAKLLCAAQDGASDAEADDRRAGWADRDRMKPDAGGPLPTDDFGDTLKTISGRVMGTPGFLAPEQIAQDASRTPGELADVYSLGAVLYSILTLRPTIRAGTVKDMLRAILAGDFAAPESFNAADASAGRKPKETRAGSTRRGGFPHCPDGWIPSALSGIAMKALSTRPEDRYASVQDLQRDVEDYQNGYIWHLMIDDDFSDPNFLSRWEVHGGKAELLHGELRLHGGEPQVLLLRRDVAGDVRIEFECRIEGTAVNGIGCFMNAMRSGNYREVPWNGYEFEYGGYENTRNVVHRFNSQIWIEPGTPLAARQVCRIAAERIGGHLRFVVNGREIASLTDANPLSGSNRVVVGFVGWDSDMRFSRIRVSTLGTPWKADVLDLAERQIQKGRYQTAIGLFEDTIESFPDAERKRRAETGLKVARQRDSLTQRLPAWNETLHAAWPTAGAKLQIVNDGLSLTLNEIPVGTLEPLRGLPLNVLYCAHCGVSDLEPLRGMPLTALNCTGNPIRSLEPLRGMQLTDLLCEDCPVPDLEPLRGMPLKLLQFGLSEVSDLEPLRGMPLNELRCWSSRIESLEPLRGMALDTLNCGGNRIAGLEALAGMPLTNLHCGGNRIRHLEPLKGLPLRALICSDNEIDDVSALSGLPLNLLCCHGNRIVDLHPLEALPLAVLTCGANPLRDLGPFAQHPPQDFLFDCATLGKGYLTKLHRAWSQAPEFARHTRNVEVLLALLRNDVQELRNLADAFKGHRYLFIPRFLRWDEAKTFCEGLGGHLVTITSREEDAFVASQFKNWCWFWMGLSVEADGPAWVTGERFAYRNFVSEVQEKCRGPKAFAKFWRAESVDQPRNCFMIEWDA